MGFLARFKEATIGFSGYPRLLKESGSGFSYLAMLLLLVLTLSAIITRVQVQGFAGQVAESLAQLPDFRFEEGRFFFDGPMPYRLEDASVLVIVDTTGGTTAAALDGAPPGSLLVTRSAMFMVGPAGSVQSYDLSRYPVGFDRDRMVSVLANLHRFVPIFYVGLYLLQLAFKSLDGLLLAGLAVTYARSEGRAITLDLGFKAGIYAMTMSILIQWILPGFSTFTLMGFTAWWGLAILYLIGGLRAYFQWLDAPATLTDED